MNWLCGIETMVPTLGVVARASNEILFEDNTYSPDNRVYRIRFALNEPFRLRDREEMVNEGTVTLQYLHHNFRTHAETWYCLPNSFTGTILSGSPEPLRYRAGRAHGRIFRAGVNRITQKMWNSECDRFKTAFLARDPILHDTIRGAILSAMSKPFCSTCYNEQSECLCR